MTSTRWLTVVWMVIAGNAMEAKVWNTCDQLLIGGRTREISFTDRISITDRGTRQAEGQEWGRNKV